MSGVTDETLVAVVRELATQEPEFVYKAPKLDDGDERCVYQYAGQPSCIMGHALVALGVATPELAQYDKAAQSLEDILVDGFDIPREVGLWAAEVQGQQDVGVPWGEAVKRADSDYPIPF